MSYSREELVTIGERFESDALLSWSGRIAQSARQDLARLKGRGVTPEMLEAIDTAAAEAKKLLSVWKQQKLAPSAQSGLRRRSIDEALEWRNEVQGLAKAVFDSEPDRQALFRPGVGVSRSVPKLIAELRGLSEVTRQYLPALRGAGASEDLVARGESIANRLEEAQQKLADEPAAATDLYHAQGVLYTRARFLGRLGRLEFRDDPDRAQKYSYAALRKAEPRAVAAKR